MVSSARSRHADRFALNESSVALAGQSLDFSGSYRAVHGQRLAALELVCVPWSPPALALSGRDGLALVAAHSVAQM